MTGEDGGEDVGDIVDAAVERADDGPDVFYPHGCRDYIDRRVADDHDANQVLHDALKAAADAGDPELEVVNLMASHASHGPERRAKGEPRYHVRAKLVNEGMGHAVIGNSVVGTMVERGDARIVDVAGHSDDHLEVILRPIITTVEPVEVRYRDLPADVVRVESVEADAAETLAKAAQGPDVADREVRQIARALATVVYTAYPGRYEDDVEEVDAAPNAAFDRLCERADVDPDDFPPTYSVTEVDGEAFEHGPIDDAEDARKVARRLLDEHADVDVFDGRALVESLEDLADRLESEGSNRGEDLGAPYRRAASDIRVALDNHVGGRDDEPQSMAEATASGLGLAMAAESVARHGNGSGATRDDVGISDDTIDKAIDRGVLIERDGVLFDTRDVVRKVQAVERGSDE